MDLLDQLLEHDRWATAYLLSLCRDLTDEQLDQPFDIGHKTLRETLGHFVLNVDFWMGLMTGQPIEYQRTDNTLDTLIADSERSYETFAAFARQMRDEQRLDDIYIDHYEVKKSFGGTILMVILHNTEHRSEVVHILARLGKPDVEVDLGLWDYYRLNEPAGLGMA